VRTLDGRREGGGGARKVGVLPADHIPPDVHGRGGADGGRGATCRAVEANHQNRILGSVLRRVWHALVRVHRQFESTTWGSIVLGNVWPAYLFALPLVARVWGLLHAAPASTLHAQARLVQEIVTVAFLTVVVVLFAVRRRTVRGERVRWPAGLVALLGTFLLNVVAYVPVEDATSTMLLFVSSAMVVAGTLFTIWSLAWLGRCFGLLPEVRGLVLRGPYRLVRHPVYLGEVASAVGILIAKPHPVILLTVLLFVVLQYMRTEFEERALCQAYPSDYPRYREQVPRLVPGWPA
jgi:protein-S-isoprenylcysteine O-methyltransferase Ste14